MSKVLPFSKLEEADWEGVMKRAMCPKRKPKKRKGDNPDYRDWIGSLPCWICFRTYCEEHGYDFIESFRKPEVRSLFCALQCFICGLTEVAHVGLRGLSQKCPDRETMPLGKKHHLHPTAGGGPLSHHALGKQFWVYFVIDRTEVFSFLHGLYQEETGRSV